MAGIRLERRSSAGGFPKIAGDEIAQIIQSHLTQLSYQQYDDLLLREYLGKLHHAAQTHLLETASEFGYQLSREGYDNPLAIAGSRLTEDIAADRSCSHPPKGSCLNPSAFLNLQPIIDDHAEERSS